MDTTKIEKTIIGFFEEAPGVKSSTRMIVFGIMVFACISTSCILAVSLWRYYHGTEELKTLCLSASAYFGSHVTLAGSWKVIQKGQEAKQQQADSDTSTSP